MTEKKKTISPYANGPGAFEARKKALRPSFKDLEARAEAMALEKEAATLPAAVDPEDLPDGVNMGGELPPHIPDNVREQLVSKASGKKNFDPLDPFEDNSMVAHPEEVNMIVHGGGHLHKNSPGPEVVTKPCERCSFFDMTEEVRMTLEAGEFMVNAIDIRESEFSITLMVSLDSKFVFTPKPGTELVIGYRNHKEANYSAVEVYYPGTKVSYEELGIMLLTFVKAGQED